MLRVQWKNDFDKKSYIYLHIIKGGNRLMRLGESEFLRKLYVRKDPTNETLIELYEYLKPCLVFIRMCSFEPRNDIAIHIVGDETKKMLEIKDVSEKFSFSLETTFTSYKITGDSNKNLRVNIYELNKHRPLL